MVPASSTQAGAHAWEVALPTPAPLPSSPPPSQPRELWAAAAGPSPASTRTRAGELRESPACSTPNPPGLGSEASETPLNVSE